MRSLKHNMLALGAAGVLSLFPQLAKADPIVSPFPGNGVKVFIGHVDFFGSELAAVCFQAPGGQTFWKWLGLGGMATTNTIFLNSGSESVYMPSGAPVAGCGSWFFPLKLLGHQLVIDFDSGNDYFTGGGAGDGDLVLDAQDGNDRIYVYVPNVYVWGGYGEDSIYSFSAGVSINSGPGNDCVQAVWSNDVHCGSGTGDKSSVLGPGCETYASSCP